MKLRSLAISLGALALLVMLAGPAAQAQNSPRYRVIELGTLGGLISSAFGSPNAIGQVVGAAETSHTDPNGEDFCGFYASGAPWSGTTCRGFLWQDGSMTPLSTLGGYNSAASAINSQGEVAGNAETATTDSTCPPYDPALGQYQVLEDQPVVWENGHIK